MARQSYLKNAAILTEQACARAAGMFFRIYIAARIGAEGMGLYQLIYTVTMAVTLATAGLSVACVFRRNCWPPTTPPMCAQPCAALALGLGRRGCVALLFTGRGLQRLVAEDARSRSLRILAPSLPLWRFRHVCGVFMARRRWLLRGILAGWYWWLLMILAVPRASERPAPWSWAAVSEVASWVYEWCYRRGRGTCPVTQSVRCRAGTAAVG
ncbi:MAG: hypothetical protein ACLRZH_15380 [Ruthenibacterium lactatiformans]